MTTVTVTPFKEALGAEVSGVDLRKPVDDATKELLEKALAEHLALVFHDQSLSPEEYLQAATIFGPPMRQHYSQNNMEGYENIGLVQHRNGQAVSERWHTDHTNRERPPLATLLYGVAVPWPAKIGAVIHDPAPGVVPPLASVTAVSGS